MAKIIDALIQGMVEVIVVSLITLLSKEVTGTINEVSERTCITVTKTKEHDLNLNPNKLKLFQKPLQYPSQTFDENGSHKTKEKIMTF